MKELKLNKEDKKHWWKHTCDVDFDKKNQEYRCILCNRKSEPIF